MKTIKAVEMTRNIRDAMYEKTKRMSRRQWTEFIRSEAKKMNTPSVKQRTRVYSGR